MTDNEIIKALECCTIGTFACGKECPYYSNKSNLKVSSCRFELMCEISDLIKRQREEIEGLEETRYELACIIDELLMCIADGKETKSAKPIDINEIKSEAIKEFAKELEYFVLNEDIEVVEPKCKDYESYINGANQFRHQIKNGINNLVKEIMTE